MYLNPLSGQPAFSIFGTDVLSFLRACAVNIFCAVELLLVHGLEPAVDKGLRLQPTHLVLMPHMVPIGRVNPGTSVPKTKGIYIREVEGCLAPDCQIVACLLFCPNYSPLLQPLSFGAGKEKAEGQ